MPFWARDIKVGFANINAKAEGIENKPAFREAFRQRRCLVPVDGFYDWQKTASRKQPYTIALADRKLMALAGLWESWRSPAGERLRSFAIITTEPSELCARLHNRMPVILAPEAWPAWLGEEPADEPRLKSLLAPTLRPTLKTPVSTPGFSLSRKARSTATPRLPALRRPSGRSGPGRTSRLSAQYACRLDRFVPYRVRIYALHLT